MACRRTRKTPTIVGDANPRGAPMSTGTLPPTVALVVKLVAKPDQVDEVSTFLTDAVRLANQEQGTIAWFALRTTRPRSGSSMPFRPRVNARSTRRARSPPGLLSNAERLLG